MVVPCSLLGCSVYCYSDVIVLEGYECRWTGWANVLCRRDRGLKNICIPPVPLPPVKMFSLCHPEKKYE